jgi:glycosyltransferase involved in cell wall biosynthesis
VAQIGARRHYAVARALNRAGLLEQLVTDLSAEHVVSRALEAAVPRRLRPASLEALVGRRVEGVPASRIASLPLVALSPTQRRRRKEAQTDYWARQGRAFCEAVVRRGLGTAGAVYAFNGAALEIFEAAKARGLKTVLDQTAAPWRWNSRLLAEEVVRWPGWEEEPAGIDVSGALTRREEREWQLADRIVCGSRFVAERLVEAGVPRERCVIAAYSGGGAPGQRSRRRAARLRHGLRVLFAGTLELRKGVPYLLEAARLLRGEPVHIRLVGPSRLGMGAMARLAAETEIVGPVARAGMQQHYDWADVLLLPTLSEGSANVVHEALAAGLPVITTAHAGDLVAHERTGLIVPVRDAHAIADAVRRLLADRGLLSRLSARASALSAADQLDAYGRGLASCLAGAER